MLCLYVGRYKRINKNKVTGYYRDECNKLAPYYATLVKFLAAFIGGEDKFRNKIIKIANIRNSEYVLDVSCGTGTPAMLMAEKVGTDGCVVGIELSAKMVALANAKKSEKQLTFMRANAEDIPFHDCYFDKVTITYALHEMPHEARINTLSEVRHVLKPNG